MMQETVEFQCRAEQASFLFSTKRREELQVETIENRNHAGRL